MTTRQTLIQIQEQAIEMLNRPRSSESRHRKWRGAVNRWYHDRLEGMGWNRQAVSSTWIDVMDMWRLRQAAEETTEI
jgi:hypothetical protein